MNMQKHNKIWDSYKQQISLGVVSFLLIAAVIQYAIGLDYVLGLTSILLAVIASIALLFWDIAARQKALIACSIVLAGFVFELIGVHTGLLFGDYQYGSILGYRLWGVPITIGLTWFIVTLSAWHIVSFGSLQSIYKFLLAGTLVVMFDLLLEQFAIVYGFWAWSGGSVPLSNYVTWFVISCVFFGIYYRFSKKSAPSIYIAGLLPLMSLFFWFMLIAK